jgi:hypothetical protein
MQHPSWHVHLFFGTVALFVLACATTPERPEYSQVALPASAWSQGYTYSADLALAESPPMSEQITIAVVNPEYRVEESVLRLDAYRPVGRGFSASMGVDIDKVLISKGMTTKGPYPDLQEITYSDKKDSDLTLAPQVFISVNVKPVGGRALTDGTTSQPGQAVFMGEYEPGKTWFVKDYEVTVRGWFVFAMHEPMSNEKMWVKRIELEDYTAPAMECFDGDEQQYYHQDSGTMAHAGWLPSNRLLRDFKPDVVADAFKKYYPILLQKLLAYIDIEELKELKKKTAEIRELKRY